MQNKHIISNLRLLLTFIIIFEGNFSLWAQVNIDTIVDKHLKYTGLKELIQDFKDYEIVGEIVQNNLSFPIVIKGVLPDKFRMDMTFNQRNFVNISNGRNKWEYNPFTDSLLTKKGNINEARSFVDRWCGALIDFSPRNAAYKFMGTATIDDIDVYKIEFRFQDQSRVYYIDKYSFMIVRIDDDFVENRMTYYSDYRKVGPHYMPFSMTSYENGMPIMTMRFKSVKLNAGISETFFEKPK